MKEYEVTVTQLILVSEVYYVTATDDDTAHAEAVRRFGDDSLDTMQHRPSEDPRAETTGVINAE